MNIRDNAFSFVAFFMLVCSVSLLNSCGVPYEAYIYVKNETTDTLYVALEHESRYYKLDNDSGQWRHYYYTFREIASGEKEFMHEMYKDERDDKQKLYVIKKTGAKCSFLDLKCHFSAYKLIFYFYFYIFYDIIS